MTTYGEVMESISFQYGFEQIVVPGDALRSPLYNKLTPKPLYGVQMPSDTPLSADEVNLIRVWIDEGALDN